MTGELVGLDGVRRAQRELERHLDELRGQDVRPIQASELEGLIMGTEGSRLVAFRFDALLLKRLDAHVERMKKQNPGMNVSRSDAVRALLLGALSGVEKRR